ncbi:ATP-binding cassette domain-containing protein [Desulfovibrio aminophilus]|nr:ATP-binding cassette domain-containing protein [Desulfovibrio aminophilus]MCM0754263.1 ATP-binding cassette domain-containing protein [Desulfovibrio aminophilus]
MKELFRRLFLSRRLAWEILAASLFVNVLSLASPIFVIQVLNRYMGYGFDGTLITLTSGTLLAAGLGFAFASVRTRLASAVSVGSDRDLASSLLSALTQVRLSALNRIPRVRLQEMVDGLQTIQNAYSATQITAILDLPFVFIFILAVFLLSPLLALLTILATAAALAGGWMNVTAGRSSFREMRSTTAAHRDLVSSVLTGGDTLRAFMGESFVRRLWNRQMEVMLSLRRTLAAQRGLGQALIGGAAMLLRVLVYAVGAVEAVRGDLSVGGLIGVSILSAKVVQLASSFMQAAFLLDKAEDSLRMIEEFQRLPRESLSGTALRTFSGRIELRDLAFAYPGASGPLFESLDLSLAPGDILVVHGFNGSGKSTLTRLLAGLLDPTRGQILADGVELRQLSLEWWRRQVLYMPQDPTFLSGGFRENILLNMPDASAERLNEVVRLAGLRRYLDLSPEGLDAPILEAGRDLPAGIRKRLALARALMPAGRLAVFDEPTEGLDAEGVAAVHGVLGILAKAGVTIVVVTRDPQILRAATQVLDLSEKPRPSVLRTARAAQREAAS